LLLGGAVWLGLNLLRVESNLQMICWVMVAASFSMPLLMH